MILVSGGTGLVGAHLLLDLCKKGEKPRALYRDPNSLEAVHALFTKNATEGSAFYAQIDWVLGNVLDTEALNEAFIGVTKVYHCAGLISFDPKDFEKLYKTNVVGTANMVNVALAFGVAKFCHISSIASLGKAINGEITEETPWNIEYPNVYAQSKYHSELEVWRGVQEGLNAVIINPGIILGNGFWNRGSSKLFAYAKKGSSFYFPGGTAFVGVKDVVICMLKAMEGTHKNERYICVSENLTYHTILKYMALGFNKKLPNKKIPLIFLNLLWPIDYLWQKISGSSRKITKQTVKGLSHIDFYSSKKSKEQLGINYEKIAVVVAECCKNFNY